jgi:hypothetical protein
MKRGREEDTSSTSVETEVAVSPRDTVYVSCWDEPSKLMELDLGVIDMYKPRLLTKILRDPPLKTPSGVNYWTTGMPTAVFKTFVQSLKYGHLVISRGAGVPEALAMMDYENVSLVIPQKHLADVHALKMQPAGVAFPKQETPRAQQIVCICEQVANMIVRWPRLEHLLDSALYGEPPREKNAVSPTRAWVRFPSKPKHVTRPRTDDHLLTLSREWPPWLHFMLTAISHVHSKLVADGVLEAGARDKHSYKALSDACTQHMHGSFFNTLYDGCKYDQTNSRVLIDSFVTDIRSWNKKSGDSTLKHTEPAVYARAVFNLADHIARNSPNLCQIFGASCGGHSGQTFERTQFAKSLKRRGVSVLQWDDPPKNAKPLTFPPGWMSVDDKEDHTPMVLLKFDLD